MAEGGSRPAPAPGHDASRKPITIDGRSVEDGVPLRVTVDEGVVARIERLDGRQGDHWIAPGWLDIQVNGFDGHDPNAADATASETIEMVRALWEHGVTGVCPTICTESEEHILTSLRAIAEACESDPLIAESVIGIHVEGPHISLEDGPRGAHPLRHVRPPDVAEFHRWQEAADGRIRIVTLSPEYPQAVAYIRAIVADGVVASIGHTSADSDQIRAAVDAGARWSTHLGNGAHAAIRRHPNYVWDQLGEDRLSAGFIFDGHHLPPAVMRTVVRAKGIERTVLVSDAVLVAGREPGDYQLADGAPVTLRASGRLELSGTPFLAGSATSLPSCIGHAVRDAGLSLADAIRTVTANPARLLGLGALAGHEALQVGAVANLTVFRQDASNLDITAVKAIVGGVLVFDATRA